MKISFSVLRGILLILTCCLIQCTWAQLTTITLGPTDDAQIRSRNPETNFGSSPNMRVRYSNSLHVFRSTLQFDLSTIPEDAKIISAKLFLKTNNATTPPDDIYSDQQIERFLSPWTESEITFESQPETDPKVESQNGSSEVINGWRIFDVTKDVDGMHSGMYDNYGWIIRLFDETEIQNNLYRTKEYTIVAQRPYLEIEYESSPISISNVVIDHASDETTSDGAITPSISGGSGIFSYEWMDGATGSVLSTSSSLSGVDYGWYGLHVSDNQYGYEEYISFLVGVECGNVTIDFKPGPEFVDDALLSDRTRNGINYANTNYGNGKVLRSEDWRTSGIWYDMKSVLKFKLWVDDQMTVDQADLYLYGRKHNLRSRSNASEFLNINEPWEEDKITFNNSPTVDASPVVSIPETSSTNENENKVIDISPFWGEWKSDYTNNHGMMMRLPSYSNSLTRMRFYSSDASNSSQKPWIQFEVNILILPIYAKLERNLRGVKYEVIDDQLYFYHDNEYQNQQSNLSYKIFSSLNRAIPAQTGIQTPVNLEYGDNRYQLDVANLQTGSYILEVKNDKKEKFYLRFIMP